ncbi:MAG TPA: glycosyltransferase family 4 protein [Solirubrobacteraceae bacterium]|nr:glycosyltransferase family 4 protein [Solirubrobacteraceae bacterium]
MGRRFAVVGISTSAICGVRDHAELLDAALERDGIVCTRHWLSRDPAPLRRAGARMRAWTRALERELRADPPDAVLLHYSVFAYSQRGVPAFAMAVPAAARRAGVPLITVLHEFAYPWRRRGWRGMAWALTQRAALIEVVRASAALVLTADFQQRWVASRPWLVRRPSAVAPVFSNLPPATLAGPPNARERPVVGLFGYSAEGAAVELTSDALRQLADLGMPVDLSLLGAPGRDSPPGEMWLSAARARGVEDALTFSGVLSPQALSDALAACDVLLFAETAGPTTRKTTLAASLAAGRPVVAIDGPSAWPELVRAQAAKVVAPNTPALTEALRKLLDDASLRETQGARGRAFAQERMSAAGNARIVGELLEEVLAGTARRVRVSFQDAHHFTK